MTPVQGWRDVVALIGVFLFAGFLIACLPWPSYRDPDFVDRRTRRASIRQVLGGTKQSQP